MSIKSRKFQKGIRTKPTTDAATLEGEQRTDSADNKQKIFLDSAERAVVTEDQAQTVTNKSIDADTNTISNLETDNLKAGVLNTDLSGAATDTEIPSALAVKTALAGQNEASEINYDNTASGLTATEVQSAIDEVEARVDSSETALSDHLADAVDAHDASAISNVPTGNLAATDVQGALDELQSEIDALPAKTETLQNKTLDSTNTISGSIETPTRLDVKQDTEANLITYAATASDGQLCFATDTLKMYQVITNELQPVGGGGSTSFEITQAAHGLTVGSGIYHNGTIYVDAQANNEATLAYHVVVEVIDANTFVAADFGRIEVPAHGFTIGEYYFQSEATAGLPTITQPVSGYSNPLFYVEDANTLQIKCLRPSPVGDTINLDELADVSVPAPTDGQALIYNLANLRWEATDVAGTAADITYDNSTSGLTATDAQAAIDEVDANVDTNATNIATNVSNITSNDVDIRNLERNDKINYITNPDLNDDVANITGDTNLVISQETVAPLRGTGSLKIAKGTIDASTQSVLIDMNPVDAADLAQMMTISFDIDASNVNYKDGDAQVRIIKDPAGTATTIRVNGEDIKGGKYTHIAQFQTDHTEVDYALEIYWADTGVLASELILDNIQVGPREVAKGAAMSDWKDISSGISTINITSTIAYLEAARVGDTVHVRGKFTATGSATGSIGIDLSSLYPHAPGWENSTEGSGRFEGTSINDTLIPRTTAGILQFQNTSSQGIMNGTHPVGDGGVDSGEAIIFKTSWKVKGWSSNTIMSEDLGGREIVVEAYGNNSDAITANVTDIPFSTEVRDLSSSWSGVVFDTPETGYYDIDFSRRFIGATAGSFIIYKDGLGYLRKEISTANIIHEGTFNAVYLEKGELVTFRSEGGGTLNNDINHHRLRIAKRASPQTILATETVAARYTSNSGQTVNTGVSIFTYEDIVEDTHGSYDTATGLYTIPISGWYHVSSRWGATINLSTAQVAQIRLHIDGTSQLYYSIVGNGASSTKEPAINTVIYLSKDQTIGTYAFSSVSTSAYTDGTRNFFSIARIK